ncbi:MAG: DUF1178 family protein [Magnetospirillum sp.]|nr:DUF1178 family protein [Magnetospirillum sp.]
MILFQLRCGREHHFEAWFKDGATFDSQAAGAAIVCPQCGDTRVEKAIMAPRLNSARGEALDAQGALTAMRQAMVKLRRSVEDSCDYVGEAFADEARAIHYGDVAPRPIYGEASADDLRSLEEEGVAVQTIPWVAVDN